MPMDPYAALQALLRAEAARTAPHGPAPAEHDEDRRQQDPQQQQQQRRRRRSSDA
ncbi:hypothetical protein AB0H82_13425 [Streptomyces sp. NPDC050732]|uniref:hypothetical protein n=1 Tax=Streptomyces sp. NPDC050732 TaxID=3154632 RepID=UPI0034228B3C